MRSDEPCGGRKLRIGLVTGNPHKVDEINAIARGYPVEFYLVGAPKVELQGEDLESIALYAARTAFERERVPLVVDDSGLFIEALNGFPGPYSSFVYKTIGVGGILRLMEGLTNRRACFKTAAALILPPLERIFSGEVCGVIAPEARGAGGFGFDPIFVPDGYSVTFAEMSLEAKNSVSHRARAFRSLLDYVYNVLC